MSDLSRAKGPLYIKSQCIINALKQTGIPFIILAVCLINISGNLVCYMFSSPQKKQGLRLAEISTVK